MEKYIRVAYAGMDRIERFYDEDLDIYSENALICFELLTQFIKEEKWPTDYDKTPIGILKKDPIEGAKYYFPELLMSLCEELARVCLEDDALAQATLCEAEKRAKARDEGIELNPFLEYYGFEEDDEKSSVETLNDYVKKLTASIDEYKQTGNDNTLTDAFIAFNDIFINYGPYIILDMDIIDRVS